MVRNRWPSLVLQQRARERERDTPMEAFLSDGFDKTVSRLEADIELLRKLLYRNRNQHGNTIVYSYGRRVHRFLASHWKNDPLMTIQRVCIDVLRIQVGETKIGTELVEKLVVTAIAVTTLLNDGAKAMHFAAKAHRSLKQLLQKQVFLPLYTVLWTLMARLFRHVHDIVAPLKQCHDHMTTILQNVIITMPKYQQIITPSMRQLVILTPETEKLLQISTNESLLNADGNGDDDDFVVDTVDRSLKDTPGMEDDEEENNGNNDDDDESTERLHSDSDDAVEDEVSVKDSPAIEDPRPVLQPQQQTQSRKRAIDDAEEEEEDEGLPPVALADSEKSKSAAVSAKRAIASSSSNSKAASHNAKVELESTNSSMKKSAPIVESVSAKKMTKTMDSKSSGKKSNMTNSSSSQQQQQQQQQQQRPESKSESSSKKRKKDKDDIDNIFGDLF